MLQLMRIAFIHKYPTLCIARYSFIQLSELEQYRLKTIAHGLKPQHRNRTRDLLVEILADVLHYKCIYCGIHTIYVRFT